MGSPEIRGGLRELVVVGTLLAALVAAGWTAPAVPASATAEAGQQTATAGDDPADLPSVGDLLTADGRLAVADYEGPVDVEGYVMRVGEDGEPRFAAAAAAADEPTAADASWSDEFFPPSSGQINALAVSGTDVYVAGTLTQAGPITVNRIARWDNAQRTWHALGSGITSTAGTAVVNALAVSGSDVYVGGTFTHAGGAPATSIARWNGSAWSALGAGITAAGGVPGTVHALALSGSGSSLALHVGGSFTSAGGLPVSSLARWAPATTTWADAAGGVRVGAQAGTVRALVVSGTALYVGGRFDEVGQPGSPTAAANLAVLTVSSGAWGPLAAGVTRAGTAAEAVVNALVVDGSNLVIGGDFDTAGAVAAGALARWDGSTFTAMGALGSAPGSRPVVTALLRTDHATAPGVVVGGTFTEVTAASVTTPARNVVRFQGGTWHQMGEGFNGAVRALGAAAAVGVYAAGSFTQTGTVTLGSIARFTGSPANTWRSLGDGAVGVVDALVHAPALRTVDTEAAVFAGGLLTRAGGVPVSGIARYSEQRGWSALGTGIRKGTATGRVLALAVAGRYVYVGGDFDRAGPVAAANIARYDRQAGTWSALGSGLDAPVRALAAGGGFLYAGGDFTKSGSTSAPFAARIPLTGSAPAWQPLGNGLTLNARVRSIALWPGGSYVFLGGSFTQATTAAGKIPVNGLIMWNPAVPSEQGWFLIGDGVRSTASGTDRPGVVHALAFTRRTVTQQVNSETTTFAANELYVGGDFDKAGTGQRGSNAVATRGIARLDLGANRWSPLGTNGGVSGAAALVRTIVPGTAGTPVLVGGSFTAAGAVPARSIAQFAPNAAYGSTAGTWTPLGSSLGGANPTAAAGTLLPTGTLLGGSFATAGTKASQNLAQWTATKGGELKPDLVISDLAEPPAARPQGGTMQLTATTANLTAASTDAFAYADTPGSSGTRFFLNPRCPPNTPTCVEGRIEDSSLLPGVLTVPMLTGHTQHTGTATVTIPENQPVGSYRVIACADEDNPPNVWRSLRTIDEGTGEGNNCTITNRAVTVTPPRADLTVSTISNPPSAVSAGKGFTATHRVANIGVLPAAATTTRFYLSTNATWDVGDRLLGGPVAVGALARDTTSANLSVTVTVPSSMPPGVFRLIACADAGLKVPEVDESNNCRASTGTVQVRGPDLVVSAVGTPPKTRAIGTSFTFTDTTRNAGTAPAVASTTRYWLSTDAALDAADRSLALRDIPALGVGASSSGSRSVKLPAVRPGSYRILACADARKVVAELAEGNNCRASAAFRIIAPDLAEYSLSNPPLSRARGTTFTVKGQTQNQGEAPAGASTTSFYLSTDKVRGSDIALSGSRAVPALPALTRLESVTTTVRISSTTAKGTYYVLACSDAGKKVVEGDETNNCRASSGRITVK